MNFSRQLICSFAAAVSAFAQPTASITGILLDSATQAPLPGVHIQLHRSANIPIVHGADTDAQGRFAFQNLPAGTWSLIPRRAGMVPQRLTADDPPVPTFNLKSGETRDVRLGLVPKAVISGRVTDEAGIPLDDASIQVESPAGNLAALRFYQQFYLLGTQIRVDDHGDYRLTIPPGKYFVRAVLRPSRGGAAATSAGVYTDTYFPSASNNKTAQLVDTQPGRETANVNITLIRKKPLTISGIVSGFQPGEQCLITLSSPTLRFTRSQLVEPGGKFSLKNLEPESYVIFAEKINGPTRIRSPALEIKLLDRDATDQVLVIGDQVRLTGHLELPGTGPLTTLSLAPSVAGNFMSAPRTNVNTDGNFVFENLPPERYRIAIPGNSAAGYVKTVTLNGDPAPDRLLDLRHVGAEAKTVITFAAGAKLHGTVSGVLAAGVVILEPVDPKPLAERRRTGINDQGNYKFEAVPPGHYRLLAFDTRFETAPQLPDEIDTAVKAHGEPLEVTAAAEIVKDLKLDSKTTAAEGKPK